MTSPSARAAAVQWAIGPAFLAVAAWLALAPPKSDIPRGEVRLIPLQEVQPGEWRKPVADASNSVVNGVVRPCNECHRLFTPSPVQGAALVQHKNIALNHGMNARCLNCHSGADHDKLVLHDGTLVAFAETPRLCSQCHGTVYRDWQKGIHGKTTGSWDAASGKQVRLTCNQCHDPHAPAYKAIKPLPGPNTLRMGDQSREEESEERHTPLRQRPQRGPKAPAEPARAPGHDRDSHEGKEDAP